MNKPIKNMHCITEHIFTNHKWMKKKSCMQYSNDIVFSKTETFSLQQRTFDWNGIFSATIRFMQLHEWICLSRHLIFVLFETLLKELRKSIQKFASAKIFGNLFEIKYGSNITRSRIITYTYMVIKWHPCTNDAVRNAWEPKSNVHIA